MLKNFTCKRCGSCCRLSPWLSRKDIARIEKSGNKDFYSKNPEGLFFMNLTEKGDCIFLDDSKKKTMCKIYKYRPTICRLYPSELKAGGDCRPVLR